MTDERKKFKSTRGAFTISEDDPVPEQLKRNLALIAPSFRSPHMRKLDILRDRDQRIYGLLTHYEGNNICWVQPTLVKNDTPERTYNLYMKKINSKSTELKPFHEIVVGLDCVAQYEVDKNWYRGVVIEESENGLCHKVLFIDYGNVQTCYCDQIRQPYRSPGCDHFHAPLQAVCCRLYNIIPQLPSQQRRIDNHFSCWSTQNYNTFLEMKVRDIRTDYVIDCDLFISPKTEIEVIDENANQREDPNRLLNMHIGQKLVNQGVAKFADPGAAHAIKLAPPSPTTTTTTTNFGASTSDIKADIKPETKPDVKSEVQPDIKCDVKPDIKCDLKPACVFKFEAKPEVETDVEMMECKPDVKVKTELV